jgi:UDPglucose 6-dehydrogenase
MTNKPSLGLLGLGFIGSAVLDTFTNYVDVKAYDVNEARCQNFYTDTIAQDVIFLALPTPMKKDGNVDYSIVKKALEKLRDNLPKDVVKPVLIKSTLPPNILGSLMLEFPTLFIVHNPEFLTERSARHDYMQSNRFIFGTLVGEEGSPQAKMISELFNIRFPQVPQYWVSFAESSLIKYMANCFFATKVSIMNEFKQIAESWGVDFNNVMGKVMLDYRIGRSHFQVPGHDGQLGWGGSCYIKDTNAMIQIANDCGIDAKVLRAAWEKNVEVRGALSLKEEINKHLGRISNEEFALVDVFKLGKKNV